MAVVKMAAPVAGSVHTILKIQRRLPVSNVAVDQVVHNLPAPGLLAGGGQLMP